MGTGLRLSAYSNSVLDVSRFEVDGSTRHFRLTQTCDMVSDHVT